MFSISRLDAIYKALAEPIPPAAGAGTLMLSNGREIEGKLSWNRDLRVAFIVDGANVTWAVDVDAIVAFTPVVVLENQLSSYPVE